MIKTDYVQFNGQSYAVNISLVNQSMDLRIPTGMIKDLVITDSIYAPFSEAVLTINSTGNNIDNLVVAAEGSTGVFDASYTFNTDSRDMFYISMVPVDENTNKLDTDIWGFNYNTEQAMPFVIYDEEEILDNRGQVKSKIFYLRQLQEQLLEDVNTHWSTAHVVASKYANKINLSHASNDLREAYTGDSIKHLLENSIPTFIPFSEDWDQGGTKVFYTSGPQSTAFTDLEHLLDRHISSDNDDFCILGEERNGNMFLRSMSNIYKRAWREDMNNHGDLFIDAFSTHCGALDTNVKGDVTKTAPSKVFGFTEQESNNLEGLVNFSYLNTANMDSMNQLVSTLVHSYTMSEKQFSIDCKDNHIVSIKRKMHKLYTSRMRGENKSTILPVNPVKVYNEAVRHTFSGGGTKRERLHAGINRVIRSGLAFSPCISFDTKGASNRRSGRFMIMNANYANTSSPFGKIFVGEWLTTKVVHYFSFTQNQYINTVSCIKPHANQSLSNGNQELLIEAMYDNLVETEDQQLNYMAGDLGETYAS
jgi:hypothetical protein